MVKKTVVTTIIGVAIIALLCWSFSIRTTADEPLHITSTIEQEDCMLCGANSDEMKMGMGEDNLGVFSITTYEIRPLTIIRYSHGEKMDGPFGQLSSWSYNIDGLKLSGFIDSDHRFYIGSINPENFSGVDTEKMATLYCQTCIDKLLNACFSTKELYGVGLVSYATGEARFMEPNLRGFSLGNYYVQAIPERDSAKIHMSVFYCPAPWN